MRQQYCRKTTVIFGFMLFEPCNLGRCESRQHRVPNAADGFLEPTEFLGDSLAFCAGSGVAPQFGRPNYFAVFIQRHKPMLLAADPNALHFRSTRLGFLEGGLDRCCGGFLPGFRMLLLGSGRQTLDQAVAALAAAEHLAVFGIHHQGLGGLCAAVDSDIKFAHVKQVVRPPSPAAILILPGCSNS